MKKIFFGLFIILFSLILSCKKEIRTAGEINVQKNQIAVFLDDYYHNAYTFGREKNIVVNNKSLLVLEILLKDKNRKGYVVTLLGKNEILYFADIDYNSSNVYVVDNTTGHNENLHLSPNNMANGNVARTDQLQNFDFFDSLDNTNTLGKKFFGWDCTTYYEPGFCYDYCCYYVFWIQVGDCVERNPRSIEECP